ncbi:MAG: hypothetical protein K1Y02_17265 [Candidatus Hydrogenedentes bacterium]|nr:hypothetical protein [Candidatus Hydrogenedentota bacterium]
MATTAVKRRTPILLWPIILAWRLVTYIVKLTGILVALVLGVIFMFVGWILISSVIGALIGVPLFILGLLITVRALY